jgi:hypothetical protein
MFNRFLILTALATAAAVSTAFGQSGTLTGNVRGADDKPVQGAQIRFESKDRSSFATTTDARGQYTYKGLAPGVYKISVLINGAATSTVTVKATAENARVDFNLKASSSKVVKHYVWMPARTGSHMGGGWVETDSNGNAVAGNSNLQRASAAAVQAMQRNMSRGQMPGDM